MALEKDGQEKNLPNRENCIVKSKALLGAGDFDSGMVWRCEAGQWDHQISLLDNVASSSELWSPKWSVHTLGGDG